MLPPCVTRMNYNDFNEQFDNNYNRCLFVVLFFIREKSFWKVQMMILGEFFWPNVSWEDVGIHEISWTLENAVQEKTVYQKNSGSNNGGQQKYRKQALYSIQGVPLKKLQNWIAIPLKRWIFDCTFHSQNSTFQFWSLFALVIFQIVHPV